MSGANQPMQQQRDMQAQPMQQQQQQLSGRYNLLSRPVPGVTLYEEVRTPQGIRYRPSSFSQLNRLRVV